MSPSLREALASLTSDRRFAEITASFNGMNLRQRFPNLTREEQAEIVRAAREFVQKQPAEQAQKDTSQRSSLEPHPEAASDLRGPIPPQEPDPEPLLQPPESTETVEDVWVTAPEPGPYPEATEPEPYPEVTEPEHYPETTVTTEVQESERDFRQPGSLLRRPLLTGLAVVVAFVVAWFVGRQIMAPDPEVAEESVIEQPVAEEKLESSEPMVAASTEPTASAEPTMQNKPDLDLPTETPPDDAQAGPSSDADPESKFADNIQSPAEIPASVDSASSQAPGSTETVHSDTTDAMVSEAENPIEDQTTVVEETTGVAPVETPIVPDTPAVATLPGPSDGAATEETPAETETVVEEAPKSLPGRRSTASKNPALVGQIQARLKMVGYDPGPIDGVPGPKTSNAIRAFQRDRGLRVDGEPSELLLGILATYSGLQDASAQTATQ